MLLASLNFNLPKQFHLYCATPYEWLNLLHTKCEGFFLTQKKYSTLGIRMIFDQQICVPCSTLSDTNNRQEESALCLISLVTEGHVKAGASCRQRHQHRHSLESCL